MSSIPEGPTGQIMQELLGRSAEVAERIVSLSHDFSTHRSALRAAFEARGLIADCPSGGRVQQASGIDGAMLVDRKRFGDLVATAAVEAPVCAQCPTESETAEHCLVWMDAVPRSAHNEECVATVMAASELRMAAESSSELVMLDGSFASLMIGTTTGASLARLLPGAESDRNPLANEVRRSCDETLLKAVVTVLSSPHHVAFPKYTTTNRFEDIEVPEALQLHDARTLCTLVLEPGEIVTPTPALTGREAGPHSPLTRAFGFGEQWELYELLEGIRTLYYRPHPWTPAFRLDVTLNCGQAELADILASVAANTAQPEIQEPLPLYFADLWAKQVSIGAAPAVHMAAMAGIEDPELQLMLSLDYRTAL